jgi:nucleoside-diphosphate-sugar epimerase
MRKIVVTGGSGKAGRAVILDLLEHGYEVLNLDRVLSPDPLAPCRQMDLTDLGQTFESFIIAAADTVMDRPNRELMAEVFPDVPLHEGAGGMQTLLSIDKARKMLGYEPKYSWRDHLSPNSK